MKTSLLILAVILCGCVSPEPPPPPRSSILIEPKPKTPPPRNMSWYPFPRDAEMVHSEKTQRELDAYERMFSPETYRERENRE